MSKFPTEISHQFYPIKELGSGSFGRVFHAFDMKTGQSVAIKLLEETSPESIQRFIREARILFQQIENPYIVNFLDANLNRIPPYIVMEYCDGGSLRKWVENRRPWRDVAAALLHASQGLVAIHDTRGFHRDIKPDNLLLSQGRSGALVVKVGDFGLAQVPSENSIMTDYGRGTHAYLAPEVFRIGKFSRKADIYALGLTGIELLVGKREPEQLQSVDCPVALKELLSSMVESNPSNRPEIIPVVQRLAALLKPSGRSSADQSRQNSSGDLASLLITGGLLFGGLALLAGALGRDDDDDFDVY